jgi:dTDP-glucose 4,6-dehydratase
MRILLAGGAGFLGYHLTRQLLLANHDVLIADDFSSGTLDNVNALRRQFPEAHLDVRNVDIGLLQIQAPRFDAVLHLASAASPVDYLERPLETLEAGSLGTRNLLNIAHRAEARFLLASTSEVYGDPEVHPQPESYWGHVNPIGPRSVYDEAKRFAEAYALAFARVYGQPVHVARIFNTYGPRMRASDGRVISTFVDQALRGQPITIFGDGLQTRSYCYVDDLVDGLLRLLNSEIAGPINLGNPDEFTVLETARVVLEVTNSTSPIVHRPAMTDDPQRRCPDIGRARELLGWQPRVALRQGIARTAEAMAQVIEEEKTTGQSAARIDGRLPANWSPRHATSAPGGDLPLRRTGME